MTLRARVKTAAKLRFPRAYEVLKSRLPSTRQRKQALAERSSTDIFTEIYASNGWLSPESKSGRGSTLAATSRLRAELPDLLAELGVRVLLDAPCGDFNWMRHVELPVERYIGADIVSELIARLNEEFGSEQRQFIRLDLTKDEIPSADALFCRDLLLHLSFDDIAALRRNFVSSACAYLITSTYPNVKTHFDILTGEVRPVNLLQPPFSWPEPIRMLDDTADEFQERRLGVWRRDQL